jgi:hypothetical protein
MKCCPVKKRPAVRPDTPVAPKRQKAGSHVTQLRASASLGSVSPLFYHKGVRYALRKSDVEILVNKVVAQYQSQITNACRLCIKLVFFTSHTLVNYSSFLRWT